MSMLAGLISPEAMEVGGAVAIALGLMELVRFLVAKVSGNKQDAVQ